VQKLTINQVTNTNLLQRSLNGKIKSSCSLIKTPLIVTFSFHLDSIKTCHALNEATDKKITESSKISLAKNNEMDKKISGKELI